MKLSLLNEAVLSLRSRALFERRWFTLEDKNIVVYLNPTHDELLLMLRGNNKVRAALDNQGYLYAWQYDGGLHREISNAGDREGRSFSIDIPFSIEADPDDGNTYLVLPSTYKNRVTDAQLSQLSNSAALKRMMGPLRWRAQEKNSGVDWGD